MIPSPSPPKWLPIAGTAALLSMVAFAPARALNAIQAENQHPGTTQWKLTRPILHSRVADSSCAGAITGTPEIEGFASVASVNVGGTIRFYVNTAESQYTLAVYRIGWYEGAGGREMLAPAIRAGVGEPIPAPRTGDRFLECAWNVAYTLVIPTSWTSGVYLVRLTALTSGRQSYISFTVRDDLRSSQFLSSSSVNTWEAYNGWGGNSLYDFNSTSCLGARRVSFNRPYAASWGAGQLFYWEINLIRWLEREGYDVSYCTDVDVHDNPSLLQRHRAWFSTGHDEYWSLEMRRNVESARDSGVNLAFFGANDCYWQVRYESSAVTGGSDRTLVGYREAALTEDPFALDADPTNDARITGRWRDAPLLDPEAGLVGVMYSEELIALPPSDLDVVISQPQHWLCAHTGLELGSHLPGLLGNEMDRWFTSSPRDIQLVADSPVVVNEPPAPPRSGTSHLAVYEASGGAVVFGAGTLQWSWGLDDYSGFMQQTPRVNPPAQQMTRNLLARFVAIPNVTVPERATESGLRVSPQPLRDGALSIEWTRPAGSGSSPAAFSVFDLQGRPVRRLSSGTFTTGTMRLQWDGRDAHGTRVPNGLYFLRRQSAEGENAVRVIVAR